MKIQNKTFFSAQTVKSQKVLGISSSASTAMLKMEGTASKLGAGDNTLVGVLFLIFRGALTVRRNEVMGNSLSSKRQM